MILTILEVPNKKLRQKSQEIKKIDKEIIKFALDLIQTKRANFGIGLAAPQVGKPVKLIVIENPEGPNTPEMPKIPLTILVNPKITAFSKEKENFEESCLSLPGIGAIVSRPQTIQCKAVKLEVSNDGQFKSKKVNFSANGLFARVLQHEIDHLDGILFTDRADAQTIRNVPLPYKIVFLGTAEFSVPILQSLIKNNWGISLIITEPDKPAGRKKILTPPQVKNVGQKYGLLVCQPPKIKDEIQQIKNLKPDLIIVAAYGQILPKELLKIPKYGALGIHPSLLPKYRGPSPIQSVILNGEKETGVTIFQIDEKIDHGPIIAQKSKIKVQSNDNYETLAKKLADEASKLLLDTLPLYLEGKIKSVAQNHKKATYTRLLKKEDGFIEISKIQNPKSKKELQEIERKIRAFYPWPKVWTKINEKRIIIHKAHLENGGLVLDIVQPEGKKPMKYAEYLKGNPVIS